MAVVLASQSPQRSAILAQLGIPFRVVVPIVDELVDGAPELLVVKNASLKMGVVATAAGSGELVVGCDTIVVVDEAVFGKPENRTDAERMLRALRGRDHTVLSGVAWQRGEASGTFVDTTQVTFRDLSDTEIDIYLETGEWRGRAGGYAIQGSGSGLVRSITGCFWNVVGFPGPAFLDVLDHHGLRDAAFSSITRPGPALDDPRSILMAELRDAVTSAMSTGDQVIGIWQGGSAAFGRDDADSDLDIQALITPSTDVDQVFADVGAAINEISPVVQSWRVPDLPSWSQTFFKIADDDLLLVDLSLISIEDEDWFLQPERHGNALILFDPQGVVAAAPVLDASAHESRLIAGVAKSLAIATMFPGFVAKELRRGRAMDARWVFNQMVVNPLVTVLGATHRPERYDYGWRYLKEDLPADIYARLERLVFTGVHELESATREASAWTIQLAEAALAERGITTSTQRAAKALASGELIGLPTETVYGLAADATNQASVERIFSVKGRPSSSPLIVHLPDQSQLHLWAEEVSSDAQRLANRFWPGPLTLVLKSSGKACDAVLAGGETIALRVPDHPVARAVIEASGTGVAAPSANKYGEVSPTRAIDVRAAFSTADVPCVLDGGPCSVGVESTIVDVTGSIPRVLRLGGISVEELEAELGHPLELAIEHLERDRLGSAIVPVPGQASSHYSPRAEVRLVSSESDAVELIHTIVAERPNTRIGVLASLTKADAQTAFGGGSVIILLAKTDSRAFAAGLYGALLAADRRGVEVIVALPPPDGELRDTVIDRLTRASVNQN